MSKDEFKWKLRYGDLINAAKEIDALRKRVEEHPEIELIQDPGGGYCKRCRNAEASDNTFEAFILIDTDQLTEAEITYQKAKYPNSFVNDSQFKGVVSISAEIEDYDSISKYVTALDELLVIADTHKPIL